MAKQMVVALVDDLDGSEAHVTTKFGIDGVMYSIDLSSENDDRLRAGIAKFINNGTRQGRAAVGTTRRGTDWSPELRRRNREIRVWAAEQGHRVSPRGRIPEHVVKAFEVAHA